MQKLTFSPSLMCGNLLNLQKDLDIISEHNFDYVHLDIMDGHFVPNITLGFDLVNRIQEIPKDIHIMTVHPEAAIRSLEVEPQDLITIHVESNNVQHAIDHIRAKGAKMGLAVSPATPLDNLYPFLEVLDHILVMTVYPGFAGQPFVDSSYEKIKELRANLVGYDHITVGVDGAIGISEIKTFSDMGVKHFVLGTSALFGDDLAAKAKALQSLKIKLERVAV